MIPLVELLFAYQQNQVARGQEIPPRVPTTCKAGSLGLWKFTGKTGGTVQYLKEGTCFEKQLGEKMTIVIERNLMLASVDRLIT